MENEKETDINYNENHWTISLKETHNSFLNDNRVNFWRNEVLLNSNPNIYKEYKYFQEVGGMPYMAQHYFNNRDNVNFSLQLFKINKLVLFKEECFNKENEEREKGFSKQDFLFIMSGIMEKDYNDKIKIGDCSITIDYNVESSKRLRFNPKMIFNKIALGSEIPSGGFYLYLVDLKHKIDSALLKIYKSGDPLKVSIDLVNLKTRGRVKGIDKAKEIIESSIVMDPSNKYRFYHCKLTHSLVITFSSLSIPYLNNELICYLGGIK